MRTRHSKSSRASFKKHLTSTEFSTPVNPSKEEKQETVVAEKEDGKKQPHEEQKGSEPITDVATGEVC